MFVLFDCSAHSGKGVYVKIKGGDMETNDHIKGNNGNEERTKINNDSEITERYMVKVLLNELPIRLPFCDAHICPLTVVKRQLRKYIEECHFDSLCAMKHTEL